MSTNSSSKKGIFSWLGVTDKVLSALFYAVSSIAVIFVNKCILSVYDFPHFDFIALMQFASTSAIILILIFLRKVEVPALNWSIFKEIFPISVMFLGNVVCGLGSTRSLSLPMLTALRRFSILMTMLAEWFILNNKPSNPVMWSVVGMVLGALIAAYYDFSYDSTGYSLVFMNNIFTALNGVWTKRASLSGRCSKMALLFYNSLFSAILLSIFFISEDFSASQSLNRPSLFFSSWRPTSLSPTTVSNNHLVMMDLDHLYSHSANNVVKDTPNHLRSLSPLTVNSNQNRRLDSVYMSWGSHWLRRLHEDSTFTDKTSSNNNNIVNNAVNNNNNNNMISKNYGSPNSNSASTDSTTGTTTATTAKSSTLYSVYHFPHWNEPQLVLLSLLASLLGSVLNYSIFLCTAHNSALTTSVIGCLKNVVTTYLGMLLYADYVFNPMNFFGVNISIAASLYYTYVTLFKGMGGYGGG